ncbi:MAG: hypothetical protein OXH20_08175 [bacterium]|nr:hypothetical protein [bacterium]MDE0669215.1 hypothetical protein [bacterium]MYB24808.1 hypothetical protein [Acidimicrobiia bacterium]
MPVAPRLSLNPRRAVAVGLVGVAAGVALVWGMSRLASTGDVAVRLGDDTFEAGDPTEMSRVIATDGPILYADAAGGRRDIWLQHLGADPNAGWHAFDAHRPGAGRECTLRWQPNAAVFTDPCDDTVVEAHGEGLPGYEVRIEDGALIVDLNAVGN